MEFEGSSPSGVTNKLFIAYKEIDKYDRARSKVYNICIKHVKHYEIK